MFDRVWPRGTFAPNEVKDLTSEVKSENRVVQKMRALYSHPLAKKSSS